MEGWSALRISKVALGSATMYKLMLELSKSITKFLHNQRILSDDTFAIVNQKDWHLYNLSLVNSLHSTIFSLKKLCKSNSSESGNRTSIAIMNGYFLFDWSQQKHWWTDKANVIHHLGGMSLISSILWGNFGAPYYPNFQVLELSTIFLDFMWFFRKLGKESHFLCKLCKICFILSFFITRIIGYPYSLYRFQTDRPDEWNRTPLIIRRGLLPLMYFLQVYWFYRIIKMVTGK